MAKISRDARILIGQINKQCNYPRLNLSKKKDYIWNREPEVYTLGREVFKQIYKGQDKLVHSVIKVNLPDFIKDLEGSKKIILEIVKQSSFDDFPTKLIEEAKTPNELFAAIKKGFNTILKNNHKREKNMYIGKRSDKITLEEEQVGYELAQRYGSLRFNIENAFSRKSTTPSVKEIEERLLNEFGIEAKLNDDEKKAKGTLEAAICAKRNNKPMPGYILVSDIPNSLGSVYEFGDKKVISYASENYLKAKDDAAGSLGEKLSPFNFIKKFSDKQVEFSRYFYYEIYQKVYSTDSPIHAEHHEFSHLEHLHLFAFLFKRIPMKYYEAFKKISGYTLNVNNNFDTWAELSTKLKVEGKLLPDEEKLLAHLKGEKS